MIGVVSVQALHTARATPDASDRTVDGVGWKEGIPLQRIPMIGAGHGFREWRVAAETPIHRLDAAGRFEPANPRSGCRTGQPVARRERRTVVQQRRNRNHDRETERTVGYDLD